MPPRRRLFVVAVIAVGLVLVSGSALVGCRRPMVGEASAEPLAGRGGALPLQQQGSLSLPAGAGRLTPSPRGDVMVCHLAGSGGAFVAGPDGVERARLPGDGYWGPVWWSDDGRQLCYFTCPRGADFAGGRVVVYEVDSGASRDLALGDIDLGGVEPLARLDQGENPRVVLYTRSELYRADAGESSFSRLTRGDVGARGAGAFAVSRVGLMARAAAAGRLELLNGWEVTRRLPVAGTVVELAFNRRGGQLAFICQANGGWSVYAVPVEANGDPILLDSGKGTARGLTWSPESRFLGYTTAWRDGACDRTAARFIDVTDGAVAHYVGDSIAATVWADPLTALVLVGQQGETRALRMMVGRPPRVKSIWVHQTHAFPMGMSESEDFAVENGAEFTVWRDSFRVDVTYDRLVTAEMVAPTLACAPRPAPAIHAWSGDAEGTVQLLFEEGVDAETTTRLAFAPAPCGEGIDLTIHRVAEPRVSIVSRDRPELGTCQPHPYDSFSFTLGLGTKCFRIEFSRPMDRGSVDEVLRRGLAAADVVDLQWRGDRAVDLAVTCHDETDGLRVDPAGAKSLDGVTVWGQPLFPYAARQEFRLIEAAPDGRGTRCLGTLEGALGSPLLSPDATLVAWAEMVGVLDEPIYYYWVRPVAGGRPVRSLRAPVAWFPDSRRVLCGTDVVDALTGATLATLPGEEPANYWGGSLSPSGRWAAAVCPADWEKRTAALVLYDLEMWTASNAGVVTGHLVSDTPSAMPPAWSPDERQIAIMHVKPDNKTVLALLDLDTLAMTPLADNDPYSMPDLSGPYRLAAWSPDGLYIVQRGNGGWSVIDPGGAPVCAIAGMGWTRYPPVWSPDGGRLLYTTGGERPEVRVVEVPGGETTSIGSGVAVGWSPDGSRIIWATRERTAG